MISYMCKALGGRQMGLGAISAIFFIFGALLIGVKLFRNLKLWAGHMTITITMRISLETV